MRCTLLAGSLAARPVCAALSSSNQWFHCAHVEELLWSRAQTSGGINQWGLIGQSSFSEHAAPFSCAPVYFPDLPYNTRLPLRLERTEGPSLAPSISPPTPKQTTHRSEVLMPQPQETPSSAWVLETASPFQHPLLSGSQSLCCPTTSGPLETMALQGTECEPLIPSMSPQL